MISSFTLEGGVSPLKEYDFELKDIGAFRCKKAYVNSYIKDLNIKFFFKGVVSCISLYFIIYCNI